MSVDVSKYLEKARAAARKKSYDYAMDLYKQALTLAPDNTEVRGELRLVQNAAAQQSGKKSTFGGFLGKITSRKTAIMPPRTKEAAEKQMVDCEDRLCTNPGNIDLLMTLGRASQIAGHYNTAIMTFEDIIKNAEGKDKAAAEKARARCFEARKEPGDVQKAYDIWSRLSKEDKTDREANMKARDMAASLQSNKIEKAALDGGHGSASRDAQTDEQKLDAKKLALKASREIRSEEDVHLFIEIIDDDLKVRPDDPALYAERGDMFLRLNQFKVALEQYQKAQQIAPNDFRWMMKEHDLKIKAEEDKLAALKEKATSGDAKAKEEYQERYKKIAAFKLQSYEKREKEYPTDLFIKYTLGDLYMQYKRFKDALRCYQVAINDPKFRLNALLKMGKCFVEQGQMDLALKRFTEGIDSVEIMNPRKMELLYSRAQCHEAMGDMTNAKNDYLLIFEHDVGYKDVSEKIEKL